MSDRNDRRAHEEPESPSLDAAFEPEAVAPDEAKRRDSASEPRSPREIVELTSPIGHRLRVAPPAAPNALALDPQPAAGTKPKR